MNKFARATRVVAVEEYLLEESDQKAMGRAQRSKEKVISPKAITGSDIKDGSAIESMRI
tara:strand:+ start:115 stop:291 length:177 start_codon:yes stop_codon:yes gene_type:complete